MVGLILIAAPASAQIYRCESASGVVEYTNAPASGPAAERQCRVVDASITVIPAPKPVGPKAGPAAAPTGPVPPAPGPFPPAGAAQRPSGGTPTAAAPPAGFPRVDTAAQRTLDGDRRRILEDELRKEEARLAELRAAFNNGEPERRGDERNYLKYLERVQRMREDIGRAESNLASIRQELAAIRN
ncbi:MAG: DUF4124 domain-containing protein [Betaproteobacteria bacterium]|nr:DUF4124 domain-containing protein [Betaproteobacteria bacterium]